MRLSLTYVYPVVLLGETVTLNIPNCLDNVKKIGSTLHTTVENSLVAEGATSPVTKLTSSVEGPPVPFLPVFGAAHISSLLLTCGA